MSLTVLIAPSGFKESLDVGQVTEAIARGVLRALPSARILRAPMVDGGEGFTAALIHATGGTLHPVEVMGPVGDAVRSFIGFMGGSGPRTAVLEIAAAAGVRLVPRDQRDPTRTTSFGVGELIRAALEQGAERILVGCGDSGVNDGGAGMAQALGIGMLDQSGSPISLGGGGLRRLARIDLSRRDQRLERVHIDAAVNWHNVLLGPRGVTRVFGPQKGATPRQVIELEQALEAYAWCIRQATGKDIGSQPGGGASGGLGSALSALLGAVLQPRYDIVMRYVKLDELMDQADLVLTAEGSLDGQTPFGKIPAEVARRAKQRNLPVVALAGTIGEGATANFDHGIDAFTSILKRPCSLQDAIDEADKLLTRAADDAMRMMLVGTALARRYPRCACPCANIRQELTA